ncbi:Double-stranded RNA-binding-like domain-containing protein [Cynara cardunculus var. scolymus]|uniref:Double-stranded RNA-binding-like domain-containing protein n=1 Tax=Cynara cardunculus var. scolymus TaxID=59895 RepID=A0A103XQP6_CYNCS|nr:Double-stranded RNA-binding-like domain-containing protein [Cynara cardunculus var. scolymus]
MSTINIMSKSRVSKAILSRLTPTYSFSRSFSASQPWQRVLPSQTGELSMNHIGSSLPRNWNRLFSSIAPSFATGDRIVRELLAQVEREKQREREQRKKAGLGTADIDAEDDEDYMGVGPLIEKLEKENLKHVDPRILNMREEPTDSESEEDDHRFTYEAIQQRQEILQKKLNRYEELLKNFNESDNIDEFFKWMNKVDKFEEKHLNPRSEYRVIGDLMNRLKEATGKDKFLLQHKLNRAIRLVKWKEAYDPNNPANYGIIQNMQSQHDPSEDSDAEKERQLIKGALDEDDEEEFDDMKEHDDILLEKINVIDRKLEEKLALLDHTFGRKGKVLEEEIRDLAEERNSLTEKKRRPLYRKGFDVKLIDVNRTCKVTKGGQLIKYTVMLACGNYHGVIGFAKAKGPAVPIACQKAQEKCFQNLHYVERHEEHTIAHAIQTSYKKTKVYLWPGPTQGGMKAGRTVQTILNLAGLKNIETPKDVQEKFGRIVVESYLL